MQTKSTILAEILGGISALSFSTNQSILLSVGAALTASAFGLFAYLSRDGKDKQIEEIHKATTTKVQLEILQPEEQEKLIALIKENCKAKYNLRLSEVCKKFDSIISGYASRGFPLLPGMANKDISDLYLNELRAFSDILTDTIFEVLNSENFKVNHQPFIELFSELITQKTTELEVTHFNFINQYFQTVGDEHSKIMEEAFKRQIKHESNMYISKISSQIEIKCIV